MISFKESVMWMSFLFMIFTHSNIKQLIMHLCVKTYSLPTKICTSICNMIPFRISFKTLLQGSSAKLMYSFSSKSRRCTHAYKVLSALIWILPLRFSSLLLFSTTYQKDRDALAFVLIKALISRQFNSVNQTPRTENRARSAERAAEPFK